VVQWCQGTWSVAPALRLLAGGGAGERPRVSQIVCATAVETRRSRRFGAFLPGRQPRGCVK
jgi:hypothetical protein